MTTGTNGPDNLSNDPNIFNEAIDALGGDDVITIVTPNNLGNPGPSVSVNGGTGTDTLVVNTTGTFIGASGSGLGGDTVIRFGSGLQYRLNWDAIERLELTGALFGDSAFRTGDSIDILRFLSSVSRAFVETAGGADDVAFTGNFVSVTVDGGGGNDRIDLRGLTGILETITARGGDGNDLLYGSPFNLLQDPADNLQGGAGNDALIFGAFLTRADGADGGTGTDTVVIQGDYQGLDLGDGFINNEVLLVASGEDTRFGEPGGNRYNYVIHASDANVAAGGVLTIIASDLRPDEGLSFNNFFSLETDGAYRIFAGQGQDVLRGGAGNDGFFFGADNNLSSNDAIFGEAGTDSLALRGNYAGANALSQVSFNDIEVIVFLSGLTNEFGGPIVPGGFDYDLTLSLNNLLTSDQRLDIIASRLAATESVRVDASIEAEGSVRIISGAGDDILIGTANADSLYGGLGADALTGGGGADTYVYRATAESTAASRDTINFGTGDRIDLSVIDGDGAGASNAFTFIGANAFSNVAGQLRAFQASPNVWTVEGDTNGDGAADLVITVNSPAALAAVDFIL